MTISGPVTTHSTGIQAPSVRNRGTWATATLYAEGDIVRDGAAGANTGNTYLCEVRHTSGTWATDLTAVRWSLLTDLSTQTAAAAASAAAALVSQNAAAVSAAAAAAAAGSGLFTALSNKNTDFSVVADTDNAALFIVDTSAANVSATLPSIATAGETERYGFLRTSANNVMTLVRNGSDTINGVAANYTVPTSAGEIFLIIADDASPDNWIVISWSQAVADETTLTKSGSTLSIKAGGVAANQLATNAVTTAKILDANVTLAKLGADVPITSLIKNSQSASYTLVLSDAGKQIFHPSADTSARTWTIPANASVAFPVDTVVSFVNQNGAGVITIAITSDTMRLAGAGTTGSRTLAANGIATAVKITSTEWLISGVGLT
jgi:hypothetical protein